jgi:hypothetical protein
MQERRRPPEGQVGYDAEWLGRERDSECVCRDHGDTRVVGESRAQPSRPDRIDFDREHASGRPRQLSGQTSAPGADLEHDVAAGQARVADELGCEPAATKEMLVESAASSAPRGVRAVLGHGRSGSSYGVPLPQDRTPITISHSSAYPIRAGRSRSAFSSPAAYSSSDSSSSVEM